MKKVLVRNTLKGLLVILTGGVLAISTTVSVLAAPRQMADGNLFDAEFYAQTYPDVAEIIGYEEEILYYHYQTFGVDEGRLPYDRSEIATADNLIPVTMLGDSVMLGARAEILRMCPAAVVDAAESRQVRSALGLFQALNDGGQLGSTVIIALGINSNFNPQVGQDIINYLGPERTIYWVNTFGATRDFTPVNNTIQSLVDANPNVTLIDWNSYATGHNEWFYKDGIHLNPAGRTAYATLMLESVGIALE